MSVSRLVLSCVGVLMVAFGVAQTYFEQPYDYERHGAYLASGPGNYWAESHTGAGAIYVNVFSGTGIFRLFSPIVRNSEGTIEARGITFDSSGNIYAIGDLSRERNRVVTLSKIQASNGQVVWTITIGGANNQAKKVLTDSSGNIYVLTNCNSETRQVDQPISTRGMLLTKISPTGTVLWNAFHRANGNQTFANSMAIAPNGNIVCVGYHLQPTGVGSETIHKFFSVLFDPSGTVLAQSFSNVASSPNEDTAVAVDIAGNVYVVGYYSLSTRVFGCWIYNSTNLGFVATSHIDGHLGSGYNGDDYGVDVAPVSGSPGAIITGAVERLGGDRDIITARVNPNGTRSWYWWIGNTSLSGATDVPMRIAAGSLFCAMVGQSTWTAANPDTVCQFYDIFSGYGSQAYFYGDQPSLADRNLDVIWHPGSQRFRSVGILDGTAGDTYPFIASHVPPSAAEAVVGLIGLETTDIVTASATDSRGYIYAAGYVDGRWFVNAIKPDNTLVYMKQIPGEFYTGPGKVIMGQNGPILLGQRYEEGKDMDLVAIQLSADTGDILWTRTVGLAWLQVSGGYQIDTTQQQAGAFYGLDLYQDAKLTADGLIQLVGKGIPQLFTDAVMDIYSVYLNPSDGSVVRTVTPTGLRTAPYYHGLAASVSGINDCVGYTNPANGNTYIRSESGGEVKLNTTASELYSLLPLPDGSFAAGMIVQAAPAQGETCLFKNGGVSWRSRSTFVTSVPNDIRLAVNGVDSYVYVAVPFTRAAGTAGILVQTLQKSDGSLRTGGGALGPNPQVFGDVRISDFIVDPLGWTFINADVGSTSARSVQVFWTYPHMGSYYLFSGGIVGTGLNAQETNNPSRSVEFHPANMFDLKLVANLARKDHGLDCYVLSNVFSPSISNLSATLGFTAWSSTTLPDIANYEIRTPAGQVVDSGAVYVAVDGKIIIPSPAIYEEYDVLIKSSHWLQVKKRVDLRKSQYSLGTLNLINGDCDGDNVISIFDYFYISDAFDATEGDPNFNPLADLDGDGTVSVFDYIILSDNFDKEGDY